MMDKKKYPTSYESAFIGQELISGFTPEYLRKASDDALFEMLMKANGAIAYYHGSGHGEMVHSLEVMIDEILAEQQNRLYDNKVKEESRLRQKTRIPATNTGTEFEFGTIEKTNTNKDDW